MKEEYASKHRLSIVVRSTVPLAIRSMIKVLALFPYSCTWSRFSRNREVRARILQASSSGIDPQSPISSRSKHQIGCLWQYLK